MPDLIRISGDVAAILALTDLSSLEIMEEGTKAIAAGQVSVAAFADASTQAAVAARGLTVTVLKTEAQYQADLQEAYEAINQELYDFGGDV